MREILVEKMRSYAQSRDVVMEGRDIGSVVFPDTPYKFYIDASPEIRRQRRAAQGQRDQIAARDRADSSRRASPLIIAEDAHVIDSSNLTIDGVVGEIIGQLKKKGMKIRLTSESLLLDDLYAEQAGRAFVLSLSRPASGTSDPRRAGHHGDEPPELFRSAFCRLRVQTRYLLSRAQKSPRRKISWMAPAKLNVIPVDQEGGDRSALKALIRLLRAGHGVLVFPEGSRTLDGNLQPALPGVGFVIAKTLAPVVPMRIFGAHEALPRGGESCDFIRLQL